MRAGRSAWGEARRQDHRFGARELPSCARDFLLMPHPSVPTFFLSYYMHADFFLSYHIRCGKKSPLTKFTITRKLLAAERALCYGAAVPSTARGATSRGVRRVGRDAVPVCVALYVDARPHTAGGRRVNRPG